MEITEYKNYSEFKERLDKNISNQAESFVEAGYLLKIARDTDILSDSGYKTVAEFAQKEYGFTKDLVSRYIAINDRFSEGGYSEKLADKYQGYGYSKLAEMLTLPDSILEEISTTLSKTQIQEIKKEIREEEKISDIEVMLEPEENKEIETVNLLEEVMYKWIEENPYIYDELMAADSPRKVYGILAPTGSVMLMARVSGKGKYMISLKSSELPVTVTNIRTGEKENYPLDDICAFLDKYKGVSYKDIYCKKEKVAPVQPQSEENSTNNDFYPDPVQMESICYSCLHNSECKRKSTITTECNEYVNKAELEKTDEQKYNEEQDRIDRETAKTLRERADEEKMEKLPSDMDDIVKIHQIRLASMYYDDVASGRKSFELRKNDRDYHVGDRLEMMEFNNGRHTGRNIKADIIYMLEDYSGLEDGFCILGIAVEAADE